MANRLYSGHNSHGTPVEVGIREDGAAFFRVFEYNGYGKAWSKWARHLNEVEFVTEIRNAYSGEVTNVNDEKAIHWGFMNLHLIEGVKIRLPRIA